MYKVIGSWTGNVEEDHPTLELANQRAQALIAEHPNATVNIIGENFSGTAKAAAPVEATA